ncbi:MAG: glycoside hydrolase family 3 N-terminal domain-containing protein [Candidatus Binatia bacterium]|nr:glycoside hydrolase family 3 N-terminal domain-containing protein [Candidatus Binatia bacterium]
MVSIPAYRDPALSPDRRVEDLLARMSLPEKVAQLGCAWSTTLAADGAFSEDRARRRLADGAGHVTRIGASTGLRPVESANYANAIQRFLVEKTRLGIPALVHEESTAGFTARDADQFPQAIGLASTWDPELLERMADVIRRQMLAVGARQTLAPVVDIARDPRWGRLEETYGEDPYLTGRLAVAYVKGIQGTDVREGIAATAKHFLGYGLSEGGHNHKPAQIGARELREVFARPFLAMIQDAGILSVMNAYNDVDGLPCGGSSAILNDLLRDELGFDGCVVADYFTTALLISSHRVAADKSEAAQMSLRAGLDVELPMLDCYSEIPGLIERGELSMEDVDRAAGRLLKLKFVLGLFENPYVDAERASEVYQTPEARSLARELAQKSIVLLKNEGELLPLSPSLGRIAVLGPCADDVRLLQGDYHYPAHLEIIYRSADDDAGGILPRPDAVSFGAGAFFPPTVTPLEGIRSAVSQATEVVHERGCGILSDKDTGIAKAVEAARSADVAVVFVGGRSGLMPGCTSGEFRDAADLGLTGLQQRLVDEVRATGTPTVVALVNGRAFALPGIAECVPAVLECWLPGEEGGNAIADVLFGKISPSGRLPVTLPRNVGQVPLYYNRKWSAGDVIGFKADYSDLVASPLFPFGHGLSYTRFEYGEIELEAQTVAADASLEVSVVVRNTGKRSSDEVVQLYVSDPIASVTRPIQQLAGFARIPLDPGDQRRVRFTLDMSQLAFFDRAMQFSIEPGEIRVRIGASSEDIRSEGTFQITGERRTLSQQDIIATGVAVEPA